MDGLGGSRAGGLLWVVGVGAGLLFKVKVLTKVVVLLMALSIIGLRLLATARPSDPTTVPTLRQTLL